MAIQPIRLFGDPILTTPAKPVVDFDRQLRKLVKDLTQTMQDAPGAGLAAPQIGVSLRVFTWHIDSELGHIVNPVLSLGAEEETDDEGCLSFPSLVYETPRAINAIATGFNMHGDPIKVEGSHLMARALQHETDHLDGILFIDRVSKENRKLAMKEIRESEWFGELQRIGQTPNIKMSPHKTKGLGV